MSLLEVVVSSVVLAGSSSAALGVWNQAASEIQRAKQLDALSLQLETARIATDRWLQSDAAASVVIDSSSPDCRFNPEALEAAIAGRLPLGSELSMHWSADPQGLSPAAYGLCKQEEARS